MSKTVPIPAPRPSYNPLTAKDLPQTVVIPQAPRPRIGLAEKGGRVRPTAANPVPTSKPMPPARDGVEDFEFVGNVNDPGFDPTSAKKAPAPVADPDGEVIGNINDPDFGAKIAKVRDPAAGYGPVMGAIETAGDALVEGAKGVPEGVVNTAALAIKGAAVNAVQGKHNAKDFVDRQLALMDRMDAGQTIENAAPSIGLGASAEEEPSGKSGRLNPAQDVLGYQQMDDEGRQIARAEMLKLKENYKNPGSVKDSGLYQAGKSVEQFGKDLIPAAPGWEKSTSRGLGTGLGSVVGGVAASLIPGVGPAVAGATFGLGGQGEAADKAIDKGATDEQVRTAGTFGLLPGMTDVVPIETLLDRLPGPVGAIVRSLPDGMKKSVIEKIARVGWQATVEGAQEGGQQVLQNAIAQNVYDPNQSLMGEVGENVAMGAGVGAIVEGLMPGRSRGGSPAPAVDDPAAPVVEPEVPVAEPAAPVDAGVPPVTDPAPPTNAPRPTTAPVESAGPTADPDLDTTIAELETRAANPAPAAPAAAPAYNTSAEEEAIFRAADFDLDEVADMPLSQVADEIKNLREQGYAPDPAVFSSIVAERAARQTAPVAEQIKATIPAAPVVPGTPGTRTAPAREAFDEAAAIVARAPSEAQKRAGNYQKAHVKWKGLDIAIETPKGATRSGVNEATGEAWEVPELPAHYGYVKGSTGADGDQVDVYMGDAPESDVVYVVNQVDPDTGAFDEVKAIAGAVDEADAGRIYDGAFSDGRAGERAGEVTAVSADEFKDWLKNGDTTQPFVIPDEAPAPAARKSPLLRREPALMKRPVLDMLKRAGGVYPRSPLASELQAMGITPQNSPGVFNVKGRRAADNFVAAEYPLFEGMPDDGNGYIPEATILDAIRQEIAGAPLRTFDESQRETAQANRADTEKAVQDTLAEFLFSDPDGKIAKQASRLVMRGISIDDAIETAVKANLELTSNERDRIAEASGIPFDGAELDVEPEGRLPWDDAETMEAGGAGSAPAEGGEPVTEGGAGPSAGELRGDGANEERAPAVDGAQTVIPGAEQIGQGALAQRKADEKLKAKAGQKDMDVGMFGSGVDQTDLLDRPAARKPVDDGVAPAAETKLQSKPEQTSSEPKEEPKPASAATSNPDPLAAAFRDRLLSDDGKFQTIIQARKFAVDNGFQTSASETDTKLIEEKIELGLVLAARKIIADGSKPDQVYNELIALYNRQPNLGTRTSASMAEQAYSTPMPLAYLASRLAGVTEATSVLEPTAGNGALLMEANPGTQKVYANELNDTRAGHLRAQGFEVSQQDGSEAFADLPGPFDTIIANPPFGAVREGGTSKIFDLGNGYKTTAIDQAVSLNALEDMTPTGRAVLIVGSVKDGADATRADGYGSSQKRKFYKKLYDSYNVVDHFTVSGDLYKKQGAGWPVDVIVIQGKGKSARKLPAADLPPMFRTWDSLKGKLDAQSQDQATGQGADAQRPGDDNARPDRPASGDLAQAISGRRGGRDGGGADPVAERPVAGNAPEPEAGGRGGDADRGERSGARGDRPAVDEPAVSGERAGAGANGADTGRASDLDPFDAAFDAGQDEADARAAPAAAPPRAPRTKAQVAKSAATNAVQSADAALSALSTLFNSKGRPGSGLSFDEDTYAKAKPLFQAAAAKFREAASDVAELVRRMVVDMRENHGLTREGMEAMRPYLRRFTEEMKVAEPAAKPSIADIQKSVATEGVKLDLGWINEPKIDDTFKGNVLHIGWIEAQTPGKGAGSVALKKLTDFADKNGIMLSLDLDNDTLQSLYERNGFVRDYAGGETMERLPVKPAPAPKASAPKASTAKADKSAGQIPYVPHSERGTRLNTLVPAGLGASMQASLDRIKADNGAIDTYVASKLGYKVDEVGDVFSAEQIDAIALAISNVDAGAGFIIGDQTGIGKGRVVAAAIRYAHKQGMTPVFVTEKPDLYGDMFRDLTDIRWKDALKRDPEIFMTNAGTAVPLDEEAVSWISERDEAKSAGKPQPPRRGEFMPAQTAAKSAQAMNDILSGKLKPDVVFTTYDQMNSIAGQETPRRKFLDQIVGRSFLIMDEAHNAGGQGAAATARAKKGATPPRAEKFREWVQQAGAVMYSSATYAKNPQVMDLYSRTDMAKAVENIGDLPALITKGGVPLQQVVASMLARSGQYARRERSFEGVEYGVETAPVDEDVYASFAGSIRNVFAFDEDVSEFRAKWAEEWLAENGAGLGMDNAIGEMSVNSTGFTSIMHNVVNQMVLSIKANAAADRAIKALQDGEKPVIALSFTSESFITDYADAAGLKEGDEINIGFGDVMQRYLDRTRRITIKMPDETKKHVMIPLSDLDASARRLYDEAKASIENADFSGLPVSPIDWLRHRLTEAGYSVREITGRSTMIDYATNTYVTRPSSEQGSSGKRVTIKRFNDGTTDAVILNRSGSTGVSMHASSKFKNTNRRRMILLQADPNIDTHMQMLGRVHRTGQIIPPAYSQMTADIPAEARPTAVLLKKMASLNANTTASRKSKFSADSAVDFMNEYGDEVAVQWAADNFEDNIALGQPIKFDENGKGQKEGAIQKLTGRLMLLPPARQEELLETLSTSYASLLAQKDAMGENALEAKTMDLQARVESERIVKAATGKSPFEGAAVLQKVSVKSQGRAMTPADIISAVSETLGQPVTSNDFRQIETLALRGRDWKNRRVEAIRKEHAAATATLLKGIKDAEVKNKASAKETAAEARWSKTMDTVYPGARVTLKGETEMPAVVLKVEQRGKAKSKVAASDWLATFAIPDSTRQMTIPFSQVYPEGVTMPEDSPGVAVSLPRWTDSVPALEQLFVAANKEGRETRYIVSGNLLGGYDTMGGAGQIVQYTNDKGDVQPGLLMGRGFTVEGWEKSRRVKFTTAGQVMSFVDRSELREIQDLNGVITLLRSAGGGRPYRFDMPKARATGGKFFTDQTVRDIYDRWIAQGSRMVADVDRPTAERLVGAMQKLGATFAAGDEQALADEIAGKTQYSMVPVSDKARVEEAAEAPAGWGTVDGGFGDPAIPAMTQEMKEKLEAIIYKATGGKVPVEFKDKIVAKGGAAAWGKTEDFHAGGVYLYSEDGRHLIRLSMASADEITAYHEAFHDFQRKYATEDERKLLARSKDELKEYLRDRRKGAVDVMSQSEIEADAAGLWAAREDRGEEGKGRLHIGIRRLWRRLFRLLKSVKSFLQGNGFRTWEDVFADFRSGKAAKRAPASIFGGKTTYSAEFQRAAPRDPQATYETPTEGNTNAVSRFITTRISRRLLANLPSETNVRRKLQDRMIDLKQLQTAIQAAGGKIGEAYDAYRAESLYAGRTGARMKTLRDVVNNKLVKKMREFEVSREDLDRFMYARHAPERNDKVGQINNQIAAPSGMTNEEAAAIMKELAPRRAQFDELAAIVDGIIQKSRNDMLESGLISQETFDAWSDQYQFYVPLRGFEADENTGERPRTGQGYSIRGKEAKQALGRSSLSDSPLLYALMQAEQAIIRSEKNRVGKTLLRLLKAHPNKEVAEIDKREPIRSINKRTGLVEVSFMPPGFKQADNVVSVKVGGKEHHITIHHEGLARNFRMLGNEQLGPILAFMGKMTRALSALATRYNPAFVIPNFVRDLQTSMVHLSEFNAKGLQKDVLLDVRKAIGGVYGGLRGKDSTEWQKWYREFTDAGGEISFFEVNDIDKLRKQIEGSLSRGKAKEMWQGAFDYVDTVNSSIENGVRLSTYANLRRRGFTKEQAASAARELTVNFNRKGEWGAAMNALYMFSNAAVQGNVRMLQSLKRSKWTRRAAIGIAVAGLASDLFNYWAGGDDDDDGMNYWDKVPAYEKERNFMLAIPGSKGQFIKIPLPYGYNLFSVIGQNIGAVGRRTFAGAQGKPALTAAADVALSIAGSQSPIGTAPSLVQLASPTLADPFVQIAENKNWTGAPIRPKRFDDTKPEAFEYFKGVSPYAKSLAQVLNAATGGNEYKPGGIDISPEDIEHMANFVAGGTGAFIKTVIDIGTNAATGNTADIEAARVPILKSVYGNVNQHTNQMVYYDLRDDAILMERQIKGFSEAGASDEVRKARESDPVMAKAFPTFLATEKALRKLRKQERAILAAPDMADDRRKAQVEAVRKQMEDAMTRARKAYEEAREAAAQ